MDTRKAVGKQRAICKLMSFEIHGFKYIYLVMGNVFCGPACLVKSFSTLPVRIIYCRAAHYDVVEYEG